MYYSSGNYEAFARPKKPEGVDQKSAYLIGSGLASLAAAAFLIRDGQMKGERIHILEELKLPGGSLDGIKETRGYIMRGGREMESHFECLWDLFRSIPSLEVENASVLDEFYWLNKEDPNYSKCRVINSGGKRLETDGLMTLTQKANKEIIELCLTKESKLDDVKISDVFSEEFFNSNFWIYWKTMFAFEPWHSAMEMRRYLLRFIHHIGGLADFKALKFTKYNQYESLVMPLIEYLKSHGVSFEYGVTVENIKVEANQTTKIARQIIGKKDDQPYTIDLTVNDLVFITNGSITESTTYGDNNTPAPPTKALGGAWTLWKNLSEQCRDFGNPEKFYENIPEKSWFVSATATTNNKQIIDKIESICKRNPLSGRTVTGGIITVHDSNWQLSFTLNRQQQFKAQAKDEVSVWIYALYSDVPGNYIKKPIIECTGSEIAQEWMYHMGMDTAEIQELAEQHCNTIPVYMPYITAYFMPRKAGDRPLVIPEGSQNIAFIGNFAETERDTVFTTEYSVRTAMEAVYRLLNVDRGVPEVYASSYDIRKLLYAMNVLNDGKKIDELEMPKFKKLIEKQAMKKVKNTYIEELLQEAGLV